MDWSRKVNPVTWINFRSVSGLAGNIIGKGLDAEQPVDWALAVVAGSQKLRPEIKVGGTWYYFDGAATLSAGVWYHVAMVYDGGSARGYVNGVLDSSYSMSGQLQATDNPMRIGAYAPVNGTASKCWFDGKIDEVSLYNRALSATELQNIYNATTAGKCAVPVAPFIAVQPQSNTVMEASSPTFTVGAGGSPPLSYQWSFNGTNIIGATGALCTLSNVQLSQAGNYSVVVTNFSGSVTSSIAQLTVAPLPAEVRVIGTNAMSGTTVTVPLMLVAKGNENASGFSLNFNTQRLVYVSAALGADASGSSLLLNTTGVSTGRLGVAVALASGTTFLAGTQQIATVTFSSPVNTSTQSVSTTISFVDTPVLRQVSDISAHTLAASYTSGNVTLLPTDLEGDVTPRPDGDRVVSITDWVQAGRFAALIDTPADGGEFQRADCAPRGTLGDGQIKVTDWVQAGRYAAGLDSPTAVGGPTSAVPPAGNIALPALHLLGTGREVRVANSAAIQGVTVTLPVSLQSQGDENALEFSLVFDPAKFTFLGATNGSAATGSPLHVNTNQVASGKVGLVLALPIGSSFTAGSCEVVKLTLRPNNSAVGSASVGFGDQPLPRVISDSVASELSATYVASAMTVNPLPSLNINAQNGNTVIAWPLWAEGFDLQVSVSNSLPANSWSNVVITLQTNAGNRTVTLPLSLTRRYFRLQHP